MTTASKLADRLIAGGNPATAEELLDLLRNAPRNELREAAHRVTAAFAPKHFDFCSIVNARSGRCPENCKWCAQSAHWKTGCEEHGFVGADACAEAAKKAEANGADRIGIVTSGRAQTPADVDALCDALRAMRRESEIELCGSLGLVSEADLAKLKDAGLARLHCNLETAPSLFPSLCSTHTQAQKLGTLRAARRLGMQICCGGIVGMGETDEQLVEFALALRDVAPDSIPVNFLHPVEGTPLGARGIPDPERAVDAVAVLRLANPATPLRFAGGRRDLSDETAAACIHAGMDAGIAGPLLTTPGADFDDDRALAQKAGYHVTPPRARSGGAAVRHEMKPTIFLRRGFNGLDDPPEAMATAPGLRRTALVFSPPVINVDGDPDDWELCADVYWRIVADIGRLLPDATLCIVAAHGTARFSTPEEWMAADRRKFEADPDDVHEPPARCVWRDGGGRTRVDARTEYWYYAGGPSPYSDSWTISFYSDTPELDEAIHGAILRRCAEAGLRIADEKPETPGSVRIPEWPDERWTKRIMWGFFACFVIASVVRMDTWPDRAAMVGIFLFVWAVFKLVERINLWREERRVRKADLYGENGDA